MSSFDLDIATLHAAYRSGGSPVRTIETVFARIGDAGDPGIFIDLESREALIEAAERLPAFDPGRYPLWGIPFAVKDNIDVAGRPTTAACPDFAFVPERSATAVDRLLDAGALLVGKTNLDQFATGLVGVRTPYPIPRNPFDASRVPGGSSSGSAVAVARGLVSFALGTDTAGSGRVPAGLNDLVGLKPSLGAVSTRGILPACRTLDCVSVFASTVADARSVFDCMAAFDPADPYSRPVLQEPRTLKRLGIPRREDLRFFGDALADAAFDAAVAEIEALGHRLSPVDMTAFFAVAALLYEGPWVAERRAAIRTFMDRSPEALFPVTRAILGGADRFSAADAFEAFYRLADLRRESEAVWTTIDALVVPTAPIAPRVADLEADPIGPNARLGTYTNFVNLLDLAALAVPGPFRTDGMPAGVTLIAPRGTDHALAHLGAEIFPGKGARLDHVRSAAA
jgi:allophanate hydrolase